MEKLTIQQLAPYLPYGLEGEFQDENEGTEFHTAKLEADNIEWFLDETWGVFLYPISCLTKEITHEGKTFCPYIELMKLFSKENAYLSYDIHDENIGVTDLKGLNLRYVSEGVFILSKGNKQFGFNCLQLFQKLAEWHINFNGIPEGQYIDKETLK